MLGSNATAIDENLPPAVAVPSPETSPVAVINPAELQQLGQNLSKLFEQYVSDRRVAELKWLRNLRQYLGIYDPDIENQIGNQRSKAYPRITRVKCVSVLSRIMHLMFPGNERNWSLQASPAADMSPDDVMAAIKEMMQRYMDQGGQPPPLSNEVVEEAVQTLAEKRAKKLSTFIDDQLQEIGGNQTIDYIQLNRRVVASGIQYGIGVLKGPFVREAKATKWMLNPMTGQPQAVPSTQYKPLFEFLPIWDFYPDLSAKTLQSMDGYFTRVVMSRSQVRELADRVDFFGDMVRKFLKDNVSGNYKAQTFETELRTLGVKTNVNDQKAETAKYEAIVWNGPVSGHFLRAAGVDVPDATVENDIEAEVWMIGTTVIKAVMNPWRALDTNVKTIHCFIFDEDDTSPVGNGLPNVMRDSQMSICAAVRMLLDNASATCGPNLEMNTDLLRADQDLTAVSAYKMWYREGMGAEAQYPAVRNITIDAHIDELMRMIDLFMKFADLESFVGPATGGDMEKGPSEPFRTAAGASMLRGDAALPFKDVIRNFDSFTQSVIYSLVQFNKKFNPDRTPEGDYNVIARGATSLISKEIRGVQLDGLAATLTPEDKQQINNRKLLEARLAARDADGVMLSEEEVRRNNAASSKSAQEMQDLQTEAMRAEIRKTLSDAFKNVAQGQKNSANADAVAVNSAMALMEGALNAGDDKTGAEGSGSAGGKVSARKSKPT